MAARARARRRSGAHGCARGPDMASCGCIRAGWLLRLPARRAGRRAGLRPGCAMLGGHGGAPDAPVPGAEPWKTSRSPATSSAAASSRRCSSRQAGCAPRLPPQQPALRWSPRSAHADLPASPVPPAQPPRTPLWALPATPALTLLGFAAFAARAAMLRCAAGPSRAALRAQLRARCGHKGSGALRCRATLTALSCLQDSQYFQDLTRCCNGNREHAAFVDPLITVIPDLMTPQQNLDWYTALSEMFSTTQRICWAGKLYTAFVLEGDKGVLGDTGAEGRVKVLLAALVARAEELLGRLGFENQLWVEILGMGKSITVRRGKAVGTVPHKDVGGSTKLIISVCRPGGQRGIHFSGAAAPRGGATVMYPLCAGFLGTDEGFLEEEAGGRPGLLHESECGEKAEYAIVLRFERNGGGRVTARHHPLGLGGLFAAAAAAETLYDASAMAAFDAAHSLVQAVIEWQPAKMGQFEVRVSDFVTFLLSGFLPATSQAMHAASGIARGGDPSTAGRLTTLTTQQLLEQIPLLSVDELALCVHAPGSWQACAVAACACDRRLHMQSISIARDAGAEVAVGWPELIRVTGLDVDFPRNYLEQLLVAIYSLPLAQRVAAVQARMEALSEGLKALWADRAATHAVPPMPPACSGCGKALTTAWGSASCGRISYEPGLLSKATRGVWLCNSCCCSLEKGRLALNWATTPPTPTFISGPRSAAGVANAAAAAPFAIDQPKRCMVTGCTRTSAKEHSGYLRRVFQFPCGPARGACGRHIWVCTAHYKAVSVGRLQLTWPDDAGAAGAAATAGGGGRGA